MHFGAVCKKGFGNLAADARRASGYQDRGRCHLAPASVDFLAFTIVIYVTLLHGAEVSRGSH